MRCLQAFFNLRMTLYAPNKFYKEPYSDLELDNLRKHASLKKIFLSHLVSSLRVLLLFMLISFFIPIFPHPEHGYGGETPSSFNDYAHSVEKAFLISMGFIAFAILITTIIDFIRSRLDILYKFKKVGNFEVTKIIYGEEDVKLLRLKGGHKLKLEYPEPSFDKIKEHDFVQITRTATNRRIGFKLLSDNVQ